MRTSLRALAVLAASLAGAPAAACGICDEDRVAAVFDAAVVDAARARKQEVVFFSVEAPAPAPPSTRRAILAALYASGAIKGSARVSLENASASAAYDPARVTLGRLSADAMGRLAPLGVALAPLRFIGPDGALTESPPPR